MQPAAVPASTVVKGVAAAAALTCGEGAAAAAAAWRSPSPQTRPPPLPRQLFWAARKSIGPAPPRTTRRDWVAAAELGSWAAPLTAAPGRAAALNPGRKRLGQ